MKHMPAALHSIHRILVEARLMAYDEEPADRIAKILDRAEILPTLLANDCDESAFFQLMLEGTADSFPKCRGILLEYLEACGTAPSENGEQVQVQKLFEESGLHIAGTGKATATPRSPAGRR